MPEQFVSRILYCLPQCCIGGFISLCAEFAERLLAIQTLNPTLVPIAFSLSIDIGSPA